jgi:threonine/homoserine/homoserine lactone efflux protein
MLSFFIQGFVLGFPAAAQPGPLQAFYLGQTIKVGWRRTLPATLAPLLSDGPIIALVLLVLTQLPPWLLSAMRIGGGVFLLYLAWGAWRDYRQYEPLSLAAAASASQGSLGQAVLLNLLNPNPYIFWSAIAGPILLDAWRISASHAAVFLLGFYGVFVSGLAAFVIVVGGLGRLDEEGRFGRILTLISAIALLAFGCYQLWQGIMR